MSDQTVQYDVSVIIPVYNAEKYLKQCIDSLLAQTEDNIEIIVVNDGSTDGSAEIVGTYLEKFDNICLINQENKGAPWARISGINAAHGKYLGFVDADDFVKPEMYKVLYDLAEANAADLVYCNYEFYPHKVASKVKWFREYNGKKDWSFLDKNTAFWNKLFRRDLLDRVNITYLCSRFGEYAPILPMLEAEKICFTKDELYCYRVGHNSMSGGSFDGKVQHYIKGVQVSKTLKEMLNGKPYRAELEEYFDYRYIYALLLLLVVAAKNKDRDNYLYARQELINNDYKKNRYLDVIIKANYGSLKSWVMTRIMPISYNIACVIASIALR